ncbi:uncharacterized protein LOC129757263 [Uranotaenia lowii]|uniref:uncharacterized protein LOC129757263 n=1 Tax=Uranotaenia lowii TaxID=190385 RepID=UPI00247B0A9D|nr:uncharacterized protein LOC129757263 [Uranotaenia lowii]
MFSVVQLPHFVEQKLAEIALREGYMQGSYRIEQETCSGKGFIGQLVRVSISEPDKRTLALVCKFPPQDGVERERYNCMVLFEREILVYREILPEFERIQLEYGLGRDSSEGFWNYPKCYWASYDEKRQESVLIMEDLGGRKLQTKDCFVPLDFEHSHLLMQVLGKMTACSFALREKKPEVFTKIRKLNDLLSSVVMTTDRMKPLSRSNCELAASIFQEPNELHIRDKFLSLRDGIWEKTRVLMDSDKAEPYGAFTHGDCWTNNIMFGYDPITKSPNEILLLDFQMARYSTPVLDFLGCFNQCGEVSLRRERLTELLETFYSSFATTFRKFGGDPESSFPYEAIEQQMCRFGMQTVAMGTYCIPILAQLKPDFFEDSERNRKCETHRAQWERYEQMMRDLVRDTERFDDL